ncbi:hypothetical protein [Noviherbaspirillum malthae]|uniref:hypothetical protein n=1 Tax=Noviherbaspirillum malthae TaxID=1260987 RepID=UPI00188F2D49|nr:hypothetical protein [Noviherbaspirillum malthae]
MKVTSPVIFALLAAVIPATFAQDKVVAPSPATSATIDLYEQPDAAHPARQINVGQAGLPWIIQSKQTGFYQVIIDGKDYWVRGSKVRISRDTTANCGAVAVAATTGLTAATPGAGKDACK